MKLKKMFMASLLAITLGGVANAATTVHITGSTAFRRDTIIGIEKLMLAGPAGNGYNANFKCRYVASAQAAGGEGTATYVILQGQITGANNPVTVKTAWGGSTGGLTVTSQGLSVTTQALSGFLSSGNLDSTLATTFLDPAINNIASGDFTDDGDGTVADITMADSKAATAGITSGVTIVGSGTNGTGSQPVAVLPFEWVANNGCTNPTSFTGTTTLSSGLVTGVSDADIAKLQALPSGGIGQVVGGPGAFSPINPTITAIDATPGAGKVTVSSNATAAKTGVFIASTLGTNPINGMTQLLGRALISGGASLSMFTGNTIDLVPVYAMGRNFDSGTRCSEFAELAIGTFGAAQQVQPTYTGGSYPAGPVTGGGADKIITHLDLWKAETVISRAFTLGQSGYNGGGDLADALASTGSLAAPASGTGSAPQYSSLIGGTLSGSTYVGGGWLVGYLSRPDCERACKTTTGPNTAHRLTYSGAKDWIGTATDLTPTGAPTSGYDNTQVIEGIYTNWESEYVYRANTVSGSSDKGKVAVALAGQIRTVDAQTTGVGIFTNLMHVSRGVEGAAITHN